MAGPGSRCCFRCCPADTGSVVVAVVVVAVVVVAVVVVAVVAVVVRVVITVVPTSFVAVDGGLTDKEMVALAERLSTGDRQVETR